MSEKPQLLLTPGPLTTSEATRNAMMRDWGSRDPAFIDLTRRVRTRITDLAGGAGTHTCVPLQGSGTYGLEAAIATFVPGDGHVLVLANGAYGHRIADIVEILGRRVSIIETGEDTPPAPAGLRERLSARDDITHVVLVHCETTSGILNPLAEIATVVADTGRSLIVDAMSSFGAIPIDVNAAPIDVLISSSNKCLEGAPGVAFVVARNESLAASVGNAPSMVLDLQAQSVGFQKTGEWRFTPPTHVVAALDAALHQLEEEGGVAARNKRYSENCTVLLDGMRALGFQPYLSHNLQAPTIVTFHTPADPKFDFTVFYDGLQDRGFTIYPGKLTKADSFRIGCIGQVFSGDMRAAVNAVKEVIEEMGVTL
ncbi:MAG: 2-aminoethylphosphonate--pyruvate transaminase [Pseudomonadota bacterium]|nr:2-aminoethylphosphonate--pyruvate transaminase [Pseudomonadota bacterium]